MCGNLVPSPAIHRAYWNEVDVGLTLTEYKFVSVLASNVLNYLTYREIYDVQYYEGFRAGNGALGYQSRSGKYLSRKNRL